MTEDEHREGIKGMVNPGRYGLNVLHIC